MPGRQTDRQTFFELFLLLAAILSLTGILPGFVLGRSPAPDKNAPSVCYLWGRGQDGREALYLVEDDLLPPEVQTAPLPEQVKLIYGLPMDLNRMSEELLQALPGVGPQLAARIMRRRDEKGAFSKVEELLEVDGIGSVTLRKLRHYLTIAKETGPNPEASVQNAAYPPAPVRNAVY